MRLHIQRAFAPLALLLFLTAASAQQLSVAPSPLALTNDLKMRVDALTQSRQLGTPDDVARAAKRVLSLGLAEMAEVRSVQGAVPASVALYRESLKYDDSPATHMWLALTYNAAGHPD